MEKIYIAKRVNLLKKKAAKRYNIDEDACHIGHIALEGMLADPHGYNQIDAATNRKETNLSVAYRTCRLSSAMRNSGLQPGDPVIVMGPNHLDLAIPYYACHFSGFSMCSIDPSITPDDLRKLFPYINPAMVFCQKSCVDKVSNAFETMSTTGEIVVFDDRQNDLEAFTRKYKGSEINYRPSEFNQSKIAAWLMLTSGTTGTPKVAIISFDSLLPAIAGWWKPCVTEVETTMAMSTLQWLSSLIFFISGPLKGFTRVQSSVPLNPKVLVALITKYRPNVTVWTPYMLSQFLAAVENICDFSCFKYIVIGGSAIEKPLLDRFRKKCQANLLLVYGMTELLAPVFDYDDDVPFGSTGKPLDKYQYKLMDDNGQALKEPLKTGELWIKGHGFFKGYLNDPEETRTILTEDGWFKTGDMFYRDEQDFYYFAERKRLMIKYYGPKKIVIKLSPLQLEDVIKQHPNVIEACVMGIPDPNCVELPIAAVQKKEGTDLEAQEIFDLIEEKLTEDKQVQGLFFVESFPQTPSGKVHRAKVKEMAFAAEKIAPKPKST